MDGLSGASIERFSRGQVPSIFSIGLWRREDWSKLTRHRSRQVRATSKSSVICVRTVLAHISTQVLWILEIQTCTMATLVNGLYRHTKRSGFFCLRLLCSKVVRISYSRGMDHLLVLSRLLKNHS